LVYRHTKTIFQSLEYVQKEFLQIGIIDTDSMNIIVLAAGRIDPKNMASGMTSSQFVSVINGRPTIVWVIKEFLDNANHCVYLIVNKNDHELIEFSQKYYRLEKRIVICPVSQGSSILDSFMTGVNAIPDSDLGDSLCLNLGDTYLAETEIVKGDFVYLSSFNGISDQWCVASHTEEGEILEYYNKKPGFKSPGYKALVGRYTFSRPNRLKSILQNAIRDGKQEISDALKGYQFSHPLHAIEIENKKWIDFGHIEGQSKARSFLIESRHFNNFILHPVLPQITKFSQNINKLRSEYFWYQKLPAQLQAITPRVMDFSDNEKKPSLTLEYYGYGTLAEKFVYLSLSHSFWVSALQKIFDLVELFCQFSGNSENGVFLESIYKEKTNFRLQLLLKQNAFWEPLIDASYIMINGKEYMGLPILKSRIDQKIDKIIATAKISVVHGDLCFNNILYDTFSGIIKLIDPRGKFGGNDRTVYGDPRYDIAKLRHSFCGNYDYIIEGFYDLDYDGEIGFQWSVLAMDQIVREQQFDEIALTFGYNAGEIRFIESLLFLSMIPLHKENRDRQLSFFVIAIQKLNQCLQEEE
tara:strand:+ start:5984 stop:7729 length:1746 start_codon:yes stop_codon:yes gene_type:complete